MNFTKLFILLIPLFFVSCSSQKTVSIKNNATKITPPTNKQHIHNIWNLVRINGTPINRMASAPRLEINTTTMTIIGTNSCNNYSGIISALTEKSLRLSKIVTTLKTCKHSNITSQYKATLNQVATYQVDGLQLTLYNQFGNEVLVFLKGD